MAKVYGSPIGSIRGKIGPIIGNSWRGIDYIKQFKPPTQRGTLENYAKYKSGLIPLTEFSYKQMNLRHIIMNVLGTIAREKLESWMHEIWNTLTVERHWRMSGINAFTKANAKKLLSSMPSYAQEYDETTNAPDLLEMIVADGDLEPTPILTATYNSGTGDVTVTWDKTCYTNGQGSDYAKIMVARKPIMDTVTWTPTLIMYGPNEIPEPPGVPPCRDDETITLNIPTSLDPSNLIAYLFFSGVVNNQTEMSQSESMQIT